MSKNKITIVDYASLYSRAMRGKATVSQIMHAAKVPKKRIKSVRKIIVSMWRLGLLRIVGWASQPRGHGKKLPVFLAESGDDVPYPGVGGNHFGTGTRTQPGEHIEAFATFIHELEIPKTMAQLCELTSLNRSTLYALIRQCRALGIVRLAPAIRRTGMGGAPTPTYQLDRDGEGDAPPLAPKSNAERCREYDARKRGGMAMVMLQLAAANGSMKVAA